MLKLSALAAGVMLATALVPAVNAADHRDGPLASGDPAADLNDIYLFINPNDPTETIITTTVFPDASAGARFSDAVNYRLFIDNGAATNGTKEIACRFGNSGATFTCAETVPGLTVSGRVEQTVASTDFRVFAGLTDDPFFFDVDRFNAVRLGQAPGFRNPGVNGFGAFNTLSIVMGIKSNRLTNNGANPVLKVWAANDRLAGAGISAGHSGVWYDTANPGHGVFLHVLPPGGTSATAPRSIIAYWSVFDPNGTQLSVYGFGPIDNRTASVPVVSASGGNFPPAVVQGPSFTQPAFGTLNFTFTGCNTATMAVQTTRPGFGSPTINLSRLASVENLACTNFESGRIDREGRPAINTALMGSVRNNPALKDAYNRAGDRSTWDASFRSEFEFSMAGLDGLDGIMGNGVTGLSIPVLAGVLLDDRMIIDTRIPTCGQYLAVELGLTTACGGRTFQADVIDVSFAALVGPGVSDNVGDDSTYRADFPFIGRPR